MEKVETFPKIFVSYVIKNMWDFHSLIIKDDIHMTHVQLRENIKKYRLNSKKYEFFQEATNLLEGSSLVAYHVTRQLNIKSIMDGGLQVLDLKTYWNRLSIVLEKYGVLKSRLKIAKEKFLQIYKGKLGNRKGLICLFYPPQQLYGDDGMGGYDIMAQNYGGEIAERAFEDSMPDIWKILTNIGNPYIVKVELMYAALNGLDKEEIVADAIMTIVCNHFLKQKCHPNFTVHLQHNILPSQIISIDKIKVLPT